MKKLKTIKIPLSLFKEKEITPSDGCVYAIIYKTIKNSKNNYTTISNFYITDIVPCSLTTVKRSLSRLKELGIIKIAKVRNLEGITERRIYVIKDYAN